MPDRYLGSSSIEIADFDIDTPMLPSGGLDVLVWSVRLFSVYTCSQAAPWLSWAGSPSPSIARTIFDVAEHAPCVDQCQSHESHGGVSH